MIGRLIGLTIFFPIWIILAEMFEYVIWAWWDKDIPWYLDYLGAAAISPCLPVIWVVSLIMEAVIGTPIWFNL